MNSFEGAPKDIGKSREIEPSSRHTANHEGKLYDVIKLIKLSEDLPVDEIDVADLERMREGRYWHAENGDMIGPTDVIEALKKADGNWTEAVNDNPNIAKQIRAVYDADYEQHALLLVGSKEEPWVIDGMHRLTHVWIDGKEKLQSRRFDNLPMESVISEES